MKKFLLECRALRLRFNYYTEDPKSKTNYSCKTELRSKKKIHTKYNLNFIGWRNVIAKNNCKKKKNGFGVFFR